MGKASRVASISIRVDHQRRIVLAHTQSRARSAWPRARFGAGTDIKVNRTPAAVDRRAQVKLLTTDSYIGFVDWLGRGRVALVPTDQLFQLRCVGLNPTADRSAADHYAALVHHLCELSVA